MQVITIPQASELFNRSINQCKLMLELCNNDTYLYLLLETLIKKNNDFSYVPGDKDSLRKYFQRNGQRYFFELSVKIFYY